jgi:hypothetical protein
MITPIIKTTFEEEQGKKDQAFLSLTGLERLDMARRVRERMKKSNVNYSYHGLKVKITKL